MSTSIFTRATTAMVFALAVPAWAQHEGHGAAGTPAPAVNQQQLAACVQSQQQVLALVDAGNRRLETARQTNDPAALRAAMDDFQATLSAVKSQLASCAELAAAAPAAGPHAGHVMPSAQAAQSATPAVTASDPHAGHAPASAQSATQTPAEQARASRDFDIALHTTPTPPRGAGENQFDVTVTDRQGRAVDGADVSVALFMPAMPAMKMPEMRNEVKLKAAGNGRYTGTGQIMMAGAWTATVSVKQNGTEVGQQKVTITAK